MFEFNNHEPIYLQIAQQIEEAICLGIFKEEEQIPSTTEISNTYNINPATILKGLNILVDKNLIEKKRGIGMFVKKGAQKQAVEARKASFFEDYINKLIKEAKRLGITEEELQKLIAGGFKNE